MAELPEISKIALQMQDILCGKTIDTIQILQEKCANVPQSVFNTRVCGAVVVQVDYKGKWIVTKLSNGENLLLSFGMGADVWYFAAPAQPQEKYQLLVRFSDGSGYTVRFWWFGKFILVNDAQLDLEPNTKDIAMDPFNPAFTAEYFAALVADKKKQVKAFLMNQKNIGGIGNMYMHDILFLAKLHPQKRLCGISAQQIDDLYKSICNVLFMALEKGAFFYETDFFGQKGQFTLDEFLVGYHDGKPCPVCGETITAIKTGSTSAHICPNCQPLL